MVAGLLRGTINLILSAFFAIKGGIGLAIRRNDQQEATPITNYEPEFGGGDDMDYSLPAGLIERHQQENADDH